MNKSILVVIGDETGIINGLEFQKNELNIRFKTTSFEKEVSCLELTGSNLLSKDKICAAAGSVIRCFTNKGKEYFKFDTNLSETIRKVKIENNFIWTTGVSKIFILYFKLKVFFFH